MGFPLKLYVEILMGKHQKGDGLGQRHALGAEVGAACTSQLATPSQVALGGRNSFFGEKKKPSLWPLEVALSLAWTWVAEVLL